MSEKPKNDLNSKAEAISYYRSLLEVASFQSWTSYPLNKAQELIEQMIPADPSNKGRWFQFGIELNQNQLLIGDIGFLNTDEDGKSWIGFTLNSEYWKQGYAGEAVNAVLVYYAQLGVDEVWASIDPKNQASEKLLKRLGFSLIESKPDDLIFKKNLM